jgi:hypothetical protein
VLGNPSDIVKIIAETATQNTAQSSDLAKKLEARKIVHATRPPIPTPMLTLAGQAVATRGNISTLSGQAKSGKSAAIGAILAALIGGAGDCLGFAAPAGEGNVLWMDTEQAPYDAWRVLDRGLRRLKRPSPPDWLHGYRTLDLTIADRLPGLKLLLTFLKPRFVILDGVADFVVDVNDAGESNALVEALNGLAVEYNVPILCVLHENPVTMKGAGTKGRGHLGSQLERKSESNLRLEKDGDTTIIYGERCRSAHFPKDGAPAFQWSDLAEMHVSIDPEAAEQEMSAETREGQREAMEKALGTHIGAIKYSDLVKAVENSEGVTVRTAKRRIESWAKSGLIRKNAAGEYVRTW